MNKFLIIALALVLLIGTAITFAGGPFDGWINRPPDMDVRGGIQDATWNQAVAAKEAAIAQQRRADAEQRIAAALERMAAAMERERD
jgi:hypothetical protein